MPIVIATKRAFLLCDDVISIMLSDYNESPYDDDDDDDGVVEVKRVSRWSLSKPKLIDRRKYAIKIEYYTPPDQAGDRAQESVSFLVRGKKDAEAVFADIVREVREQKPDMIYLDQIVERMFADEPNDSEP